MSSPADNRTTPDQTAAALDGHTNYHQVCNMFEASLNASSTASAGPSTTSGATNASASARVNSKTPIGAIVGGAVGGVVAAIIGAILLTSWLKQRKKKEPGPASESLLSDADISTGLDVGRPYSGYGQIEPWFAQPASIPGPGYVSTITPYVDTHSPPPTSDRDNRRSSPMIPQ
ncbi:hypothetical protein BDV93DRAFT_604776 [Ceratobasidium sp. AG-I]|nr:hypothetical protein BDV93DRAFT_604776 [Ceratobasidium sp. AG-I]